MITIQCACQWLSIALVLMQFASNVHKDFKTAESRTANEGMSGFVGSVSFLLISMAILYGAGAFTVLFGDRSY